MEQHGPPASSPLGLCIYTPGLGNVTLFDRDEPRFAGVAREMIRAATISSSPTSTPSAPTNPLLYWLMDASYWIFGQANELSARMPSAIAGTLTLLVVYLMVALRFGTFTACHAALILGTCTVFVVESCLATADATQLLFIAIQFVAPGRRGIPADAPDSRSRHLPRTRISSSTAPPKNAAAPSSSTTSPNPAAAACR